MRQHFWGVLFVLAIIGAVFSFGMMWVTALERVEAAPTEPPAFKLVGEVEGCRVYSKWDGDWRYVYVSVCNGHVSIAVTR